MKRLISLTTLLLFILASCDSPVSNRNVSQPSTPPGKISMAPPQQAYSIRSVRPDTARKAVWQQFKAANGDQWRVRWNKHTGLPASIFMGLTKKTYGGNAKQAAHTFLAEHRALFGVGNINQLKYVKTQTYRGVRHVTFQQTVKGIPVYEAEYKVHLRGNGQVDMANGTFYPNIEAPTSPAISKSGAVDAARSDLDLPLESKVKPPQNWSFIGNRISSIWPGNSRSSPKSRWPTGSISSMRSRGKFCINSISLPM